MCIIPPRKYKAYLILDNMYLVYYFFKLKFKAS